MAASTDHEADDARQFIQHLREFPNLFFQQCAKKAKRANLESTLQTIEDKQQRRNNEEGNEGRAEVPPDLQDEEDPENLAIFLLWRLGRVQEAETRAARAVRERPTSLLALSNWGYILWQRGERDRAWQQLRDLEKLRDDVKYDSLDMEAQSEILYLYIKLGHLFKPYALSELQERLLTRRPRDDALKFTLGQTLRRYTNTFYTSKHPDVDFRPALHRAIELYVQIKDNRENSDSLRARATVELGEIFNWQAADDLRAAMEKERDRLGLTAKLCIEEAIQLAEGNAAVLVAAGKYYRHGKQLDLSRKLLEKAVEIRPEAKAHHQLGLTLKQLALAQKRRGQGAGGEKDGGRPERGGGAAGRGGGNWRAAAREDESRRTDRRQENNWRTTERRDNRRTTWRDGGNRNARGLGEDDWRAHGRADNWRAGGIQDSSWRTVGREDDGREARGGGIISAARDADTWRTTGRGGDNRRAAGRDGHNWSAGGREKDERGASGTEGSWRTRGRGEEVGTGRGQEGGRGGHQQPRPASYRGAGTALRNTLGLSSNDRFVPEAMYHFQRSLELNSDVFGNLELALMYRSFGQLPSALLQFQKSTEPFSAISFQFNQVIEHAGQVYAEMAQNPADRGFCHEMSQFLLSLFLINECLLFFQSHPPTRENDATWASFYSLGQELQQQFRALLQNRGRQEVSLLKQLKNYRGTLPALTDPFNFNEAQASDSAHLERQVERYLQKGRYHDALLFLSLLQLTSHSDMVAEWKDADVHVKTHVLVAWDRLLKSVDKDDVGGRLNTTASKVMFFSAFEHAFPERAVPPPYPLHHPVQSETAATATTSPELADDVKDVLHVLLLHDPRDQVASRDAGRLKNVVQEVLGLQVTLMYGDEGDALQERSRSALVNSLVEARLVACVVGNSDISAEFAEVLEEAARVATPPPRQPPSPSTPSRLVALVMNSSPPPPALQGHRVCHVSSGQLDLGHQEAWTMTSARDACELFCGLIGRRVEMAGGE